MGWLFVPGMEVSNSDFALSLETITELSATSRGTLLRPRYLRSGWATGRWSQRLSGLTLTPLMGQRGADEWMSLLPGSLVSRGVSPVSGLGSMTSDGYGPASLASFGRWDQNLCSWRTFPDLFGLDSELSSETWPRQGSMRNGTVFLRPKRALHIGGGDCSYWATPRVAVTDGEALPTKTHGWDLPAQAKEFTRRVRGVTGRGGMVLNPVFIETLMGLPIGWTDRSCSAMESYQTWRRLRSERLQAA